MIGSTSWIGTIPQSWSAVPLKAVAAYSVSSVDKVPVDGEPPVRLCNYTDVYNNEFIHLGLNFMASSATQDEIQKFGLRVDDVLITKDSESWDDIAIPALVTEASDDLVCGYHLAILRPVQGQLSGRFLFRCLQSKSIRSQLELASTGVTRFGLPKDEIGRLLPPLPPLPQQEAIAGSLDHETTHLDKLVEAKGSVLVLLAEKRKALVNTAVTRGMTVGCPSRDSGLPWIGRIPAHWAVERLKFHLFGIEQGWSPQCDNSPAEGAEWGVLKAGCVNGWEFDANENKRLPPNLEPLPQYEVRPGDVLMSRANTTELLGSAALVRSVRPRLMICDKLYRLSVNEARLDKEFLVDFLRSSAGRFEFERDATGASNSMQNIGQDSVRNVWLPIPPVAEQRAIVSHIRSETAKLDALHMATERTIELLKERRAALITCAVIGHLAAETHL